MSLSNADSIVEGHFVEPASSSFFFRFAPSLASQLTDLAFFPSDVRMPISQLLSHLREEVSKPSDRPVHYLQSQNGNLAEEYKPLLDDVGIEGPAWAREAFGESRTQLLSVPRAEVDKFRPVARRREHLDWRW